MSFFDTYGPYPIATVGRTCISSQKEFKKTVEGIKDRNGASFGGVIGCYIFCLEFNGRLRPWYVGMTVAKAGFVGEVFQKHKLKIFDECLSSHRGSPKMLLLPLVKSDVTNFSNARKSGKKVIKWLEITLMGFAFRRNPEISNVRDMSFFAQCRCSRSYGYTERPPLQRGASNKICSSRS